MPGARVLVVDDHLDTLQLYATYLSIEGFSVTAASDVTQALRLSADGVDAIATDLAMPGMDGAQLIRAMRAGRCEPPIPIVVVTGQADARVEAELAAIGSCRLLHKPCDLRRLADTLRWLTSTCVHACGRCPNRQAHTSKAAGQAEPARSAA